MHHRLTLVGSLKIRSHGGKVAQPSSKMVGYLSHVTNQVCFQKGVEILHQPPGYPKDEVDLLTLKSLGVCM
jgi:hypothetical protein